MNFKDKYIRACSFFAIGVTIRDERKAIFVRHYWCNHMLHIWN